MIRHDCIQGSHEWNMLRLGKPTASNFDQILTAGGKLSASADKYMHRLIVEHFQGYPLEGITTAAMNTGREREPEARSWYACFQDVQIEQVGICFTDDGLVGASPDALIGENGLLEIKCPEQQTHIGYLLSADGISRTYKPQIQGQLWVAEREWLDSVSYCPPWPPSLVRVARDEPYIKALADALAEFNERFLAAIERLTQMGAIYQERQAESEAKADGMDWLGLSDADVEAILEGHGAVTDEI